MSIIQPPAFPRIIKPSCSGPYVSSSATIDGQLLLVNRDSGCEKMDLPNLVLVVDMSKSSSDHTTPDYLLQVMRQLMEGLKDDVVPKDVDLPHVALQWDNSVCNMRELVCNVVSMVMACRFKLRAWEARLMTQQTLDSFLPGTWTTSPQSEAVFRYAYHVTFPKPPIVLFYGHDPRFAPHHVFSQFFKIDYVGADGVTYCCSEQEMHAQKALLFRDRETHARIMATRDPYAHKKLGRAVHNFDPSVWARDCFSIVARANVAKFSSNIHLTATLLSTGTESEIYECVKSDAVWATGVSVSEAEKTLKSSWVGTNLLGKALVYARTQLQHTKKV